MTDGLLVHIISSVISGAFLVVALNPFDVITTRMYNQKTENGKGNTTTLPVFYNNNSTNHMRVYRNTVQRLAGLRYQSVKDRRDVRNVQGIDSSLCTHCTTYNHDICVVGATEKTGGCFGFLLSFVVVVVCFLCLYSKSCKILKTERETKLCFCFACSLQQYLGIVWCWCLLSVVVVLGFFRSFATASKIIRKSVGCNCHVAETSWERPAWSV